MSVYHNQTEMITWVRKITNLYHNCDSTTTRLRRKIDVHFLLALNGSRCVWYVVVESQL